ncbi:MAG: peptidoglycan D,D-transpeptidase FtsI family protein [Sedimentisphaerales bacterium]
MNMFDKRIKIFIIVSVLFLLICVLRLVQMQLLPGSSLQNEIEQLKRQRSLSRQLKTIRGRILDRNGKVLAVDQPRFELQIEYKVSCFADERVRYAKLLKAARQDNADVLLPKIQKELQAGRQDLQRIIDKCTHFGFSPEDINNRIKQINNKIWNLREYLAWKRNYPDQDFEIAVPDANERLLLTAKVDIAEMHKSWPLFELKSDDAVFNAQFEFMETDGVNIVAQARRSYPYNPVAAQTIGWVGQAKQEQDTKLFENDRLARYLHGEVCGREDGVEYVCETILRGRRGELVYDIDRRLTNRTETEFGEDVTLTLDIELQQRIENYLANYPHDPSCGPGMAAAVIDVATGDILALVSMPVFDLNRARYDYGTLVSDPNKPLINRAINKQYPPGSVVKPLILIAGLESGKITPDEIINCPAEEAPWGWPNCWIYNRYKSGHDGMWLNHARNAIKGSCNIYFSRLADRIEPIVLQQWLFKFGYGHCFSLASSIERDTPNAIRNTQYAIRDFRQAPGQISSILPKTKISSFEQIPTLAKAECRLFGMGQGNLRATPLQVANAMAAIARDGLYKSPRLFSSCEKANTQYAIRNTQYDLNISPQTLQVILDGMSAVVNESGGTAHKEFAPVLDSFAEQGIKVYGKTGSTEAPEVAWFAGFAKACPEQGRGDSSGRGISIAVVVEGGQHGSSDAAPLARDIIQFCIEFGYIGKSASPLSQLN